ncbi:MAG TPA: acyl-CoA dehydrogenase family protein [Acidimicrobiales bacterium]|nr:acyl-CoA dehydrogenase family protein [Acidimicrobiales bacterium]
MDFELSDDQVALRHAAASLLDKLSPLERVRAVVDSDVHFDDDLWAAMAAQGWMSLERPADRGGLGLGAVELAVLCEQVGRHLAPVPFTPTVLACGALDAAIGDGLDSLEELAARLGAGEAVGALGWSSRRDAVRASVSGPGGWTLSGRPDPVVYGPRSDVVVLSAATDDGPALFCVEGAAARSRRAEPAMDRTREVGWVELEGAPAHRLGDVGAVAALLDHAAVAVSAEMLGAAEHALEMTVQYAKDRVQFGRPIGSFQAVKHRCADMLVDVEGMRSSVYYAAWAVGAGDPDASAAASAAKVWCSDAARRVMASALQVHGGIGFTWEHDLHFFVKRSQLDQVSFGDAGYHRERLAAILRPRAEAGDPVL